MEEGPMGAELMCWEALHKGGAYLSKLSPQTAEGWKQCNAQGVRPETSAFPVFPAEHFRHIKEESIKAYAYSNRFLLQMTSYRASPMLGFALFSEKGTLLKLYGGEQFLSWCGARGIVRNTDWSEAAVGTNAVSMGLRYRQTVAMAGRENFCRLLVDTAVYFSPFLLDDESDPQKPPLCFGGIAVLLPFSEQQPDFLMLAAAAANDVSLHLNMADTLYGLYYTEEKGLISIDINVLDGKPHILYHNAAIFDILGTPYENLYFKDVETLFDSPPRNRVFWDIIAENRKIVDERLKLSIHGRESVHIVSTETYWQPHLGFRGVRFFFTNPSQISSSVSKRIGNNALKSFDDILGKSEKVTTAIRLAKAIANSDSNVLVLGESGVGKDVFAQAIHNASARRDRPFIVLNCAAFPRDLIASELFGYESGAFTGAKKSGNIGKFELANTGTIFLDEIGDMPLDLQATLLRVIEQKSFMRLGSSVTTNVDVKIIAATNADLPQLVTQKKFRADLFYRLSTLRLNLPPLRERGDDVLLLAEHFIASVCRRIQRTPPMRLSHETRNLIRALPWDGNVRELQNLIEGIVQLNPVEVIEPRFIRDYLGLPAEGGLSPGRDSRAQSPDLTREDLEAALLQSHYNKTNTAKTLGISRKTLYRWMEQYGM